VATRNYGIENFPTLAKLQPPRVARTLGWIIVITILTFLFFILFVPWVQTAAGSGYVIALNPQDRVQNITAMVPGRIERWYVTDGDVVKQGDPIARIVDIDPRYLERLENERAQAQAEVDANRAAMRTAELDVQRTSTLYREGLAARRDYELALIKVEDYRAKVAKAQAELNKIDINLRRQSFQTIPAPRSGRIMRVKGDDSSAIIKQGDILATFAPEETDRVVELYVDGRDVSLIRPGRRVRLEFEGWPAIQFSGWPSVARGLFDGQVKTVDAAASSNGLYRLIVEPAPDKPAWPKEPSVRLGASVRGWVLMDTVKVWFELWRQLNDFPLQYTPAPKDASAPDAGLPSPSLASSKTDAK
jgi:multidrug efflux pump subunit AcrA (membrane-fusion protein)